MKSLTLPIPLQTRWYESDLTDQQQHAYFVSRVW